MSGIADWADDAVFDGALLFDDGGTGSRESIVCFMQEGVVLGSCGTLHLAWKWLRTRFGLAPEPCAATLLRRMWQNKT